MRLCARFAKELAGNDKRHAGETKIRSTKTIIAGFNSSHPELSP